MGFSSTLDGVPEPATVSIDGVGDIMTDENGQATITLPAGAYNYSASDSNGNVFAGSFTIVKDALINVAVAFGRFSHGWVMP